MMKNAQGGRPLEIKQYGNTIVVLPVGIDNFRVEDPWRHKAQGGRPLEAMRCKHWTFREGTCNESFIVQCEHWTLGKEHVMSPSLSNALRPLGREHAMSPSGPEGLV